MPESAKVTLNNIPVLGSQTVRWRLRSGVSPVEETYYFTPENAELLLSGATTHGAAVDMAANGESAIFRRLTILSAVPGPVPNYVGIRVADRRWEWTRKHVIRRYNMRRSIGTRRISGGNIPNQLQPIAQDLIFRRWTLLNPEGGGAGTWSATDILEDLKEVMGGRMRIERDVFEVNQIPIQDMTIDDTVDGAVRRVLGHLPGVDCFVNSDGEVVFYLRTTFDESKEVEATMPPVDGAGSVVYVNEALIRPKEIEVLFSREVELRFDFGQTTVKPEGLWVENVLPVPDYSLTINGQEYTQGSYVKIDTNLFNAWGTLPGGATISESMLRLSAVPFLDLMARVRVAGSIDPDADWAGRVNALEQNWRRTFRINRRFMERIATVRANRVATVDAVSGTRAPSPVFARYGVVNALKTFFRDNDAPRSLVANIDESWPANGLLDSNTRSAPFALSVVDADNGIVRLDPVVDPFRRIAMVLPGRVANAPAFRGSDKSSTAAFDSVPESGTPPQLEDSWRMAFIVTATPLAPNDNRQLHRVVVRPGDLVGLVPRNVLSGPFLGPTMELRVGPGLETARIAWVDAREEDILALFGANDNNPNLNGIILNEEDAVGGGSLTDIAKAKAAAVYTSLTTRAQGQMAGRWRTNARPRGHLEEVVFTINPLGDGRIELTLPDRIEPLNMMTFLDDSTRSLLLRLLQHQGAS